MDHDAVQRWLDAYVEAWRTYDREAIGALFTADAEYRYRPWDEPLRGREAIVADWTQDPDDPGAWEAAYRTFAVEGDRAVATGTSRYDDADGRRIYHNVFVLEFAGGRCRSFTEVFMLEKPAS